MRARHLLPLAAGLALAGSAAAQSALLRASLAPRPSLDSLEHAERQLQSAIESGVEPDFLQAYVRFLKLRAGRNGQIDWDAYRTAAAFRKTMRPARWLRSIGPGARLGPPTGRWRELGPRNLDVPFAQYFGPSRATSGRVTSIAFDPDDPENVYLGAAGGGVWKSTDGGDTWAPKTDDAGWDYLQVSAVAVDPDYSSTVYAATGDARGFYRLYGFGLRVSFDGGDSWLDTGSLSELAVSELAVDPDSNEVLATTHGRSSTNLAEGTVQVATYGGFDFGAAPGLPNAVWNGCTIGAKDAAGKRAWYVSGYTLPVAGGADGEPVVYLSMDKGVTWSDVTPPGLAPITLANLGNAGVDVSASPGNPKNVYVVSGTDQAVFASDDRGTNWDDITNNLPKDASPGDAYNWSQSNYDFHITCSYVPGGNRDVIYCGLITIAVTDNRGADWKDIGATYSAAPSSHNDQHCAAYNPRNPHEVLFGNDGGIYRVRYDHRAKTWGQVDVGLNESLRISQFYTGATSPDGAGQHAGGTQDNATPRSFGAVSPIDGLAATTTDWNNAAGGDGGFCAINPAKPLTQYATANGTVYRTVSGWPETVVTPMVGDPVALPFPVLASSENSFLSAGALDPSGKTLFACTKKHMFRYKDGAAAGGAGFYWDEEVTANGTRYRLGPDDPSFANSGFNLAPGAEAEITCVAIAPSDKNTVYVGSSDGSLWVTKNALDDVTKVTFKDINRGLPARAVSAIAVDPCNADMVWITLSGSGDTDDYVWQCEDTSLDPASVTWENIDDGKLPSVSHNAISVDTAALSGVLYVGSDAGVFMTSNNGTTWENATTPLGLPNVQVNALTANGGTGRLTAFTFGRGAWDIEVGERTLVGFGFPKIKFRDGDVVTCRAVLSKAAPAGGTEVLVSTDTPAAFALPASVTVPEGEITAEFTMTVTAPASTGAIITGIVGRELCVIVVSAGP